MAIKNTPKEKKSQTPTLQITCTAEFKTDVDDLAAACHYRNTSDFLRVIIEEYVELNRERINQYREMAAAPIIKPMLANIATGAKGASDEGDDDQ